MGGSSASEILFLSVNHSITLMGKVWLVVMVFLRVLMLLFAGLPLYQDEQDRFVCNTIQPGCANMCYDLFSPVSLLRFWLLQLVTVCLPCIIFIIYVVHQVSNGETLQQGGARRFTGAYILHLLFRTLLEAAFGGAHYFLFGFYIPRRFLCQHAPCTTQVDCYVSRPTEKTLMLNFMLGGAALSLLLNGLDFICAIRRALRQRSRRKMMVERTFEEERCFLSRGADPSTPPQLDPEAHPGKTGSFRKRLSSKESCGGGALEPPPLQPCSPGASGCNTNGNNVYLLERGGSEAALCPQELAGTPRSIRVSKRSRLKPPPPPRRDLGFPSAGSAAGGDASSAGGDASSAGGVYTRRLGPFALVELSSPEQSNEDGQDKRSEWV